MYSVIHRPGTLTPEKPYSNQFIKFAHPPDTFQHHSFISIDNSEHTLVTAHTGSGKTVIATYSIINAVKIHNKKVIYTSPIKTLSNQKYAEFKQDFQEYDISVGLMTGDNKINVDASCVIMTTEILRNMLYSNNESNTINLNDISCVIFDEVHYINDLDRGKVWEECITMLPKEITLVMLSATIENSLEFATWIKNIKNRNVNLISTERRIVPLKHYVFTQDNLSLIKDNDDNFFDETYHKAYKNIIFEQENVNWKHRLNNMVHYLQKHDMNQTIFFVLSREKCETYASLISHTLIDSSDITEVTHLFNKMFKSFDKTYGKLQQVTTVKNLLIKGIAFHHSGLIPILKEIIEIIFQKGLIRILFATETFAVGVNMPTRTVVFTSMTKPDPTCNQRFLYTSEYIQMAGRAGRRGIDTHGNCIILPLLDELPGITEMKSLMLGKGLCLESKFKLDYNFILKALNSSEDIDQIIANTLYNHDTQKSIAFYSKELDTKLVSLNKLKCFLTDEDIGQIEYFRKLELEFKNLKQKKPAKRKQFKTNMQPLYDNSCLYEKYKSYDNYLEKLNDYNRSADNLEELRLDIENQILDIKIFLHKHNYLIKQQDNNYDNYVNYVITPKGVLIAHINECEPALLLAEMIEQKVLNDVNKPEDFVSIFSIFLNGIRQDSYNGNFLCDTFLNNNKRDTGLIKSKFSKIEKILESLGLNDLVKDMKYHYVEMSYLWTLGEPIEQALSNYNIYEGNFIHCMIKLNNIINEVIKICKMTNYLDLIPKLECIEKLIVRDVVSPVSLYL